MNYYIGLAYNKNSGILNMPIRSIQYWQQSFSLSFNMPFQGMQKHIKILKFLDKFQFIKLIIDSIQSEARDKKEGKKGIDMEKQKKMMAQNYLNVLSSFQEKLDGPSCLILKSHIHAYTLRQPQETIKCF